MRPPLNGLYLVEFFDGHRRSISAKISSAHRAASAMAATVAGTRAPLSYCASFRAAKIGAAISRKQAASAFGARPLLHCNRGQVSFANDGGVSRPRSRSKVAQKVALRLWNAPTSPNPSRQPNRRRIGLQALRRELRHEEIHVVFDSIANVTADHPHPIQPGHKLIPALVG
jgi:hypothetical protein